MGLIKDFNWDIDEAIRELEPRQSEHGRVYGTSIARAYVASVSLMMNSFGVKPTDAQRQEDGGSLWCLSVGRMQERRKGFYGQTIRECVDKAFAAKAKKEI